MTQQNDTPLTPDQIFRITELLTAEHDSDTKPVIEHASNRVWKFAERIIRLEDRLALLEKVIWGYDAR